MGTSAAAEPGRLRSIAEDLRGARILLTGATGFLGKVVLSVILGRRPEVAGVTCLVRGGDGRAAQDRVDDEVFGSIVFEPVRRALGDRLEETLREKVRVVEADLSAPGAGLDDATRDRLAAGHDLIIHCAGLVSFTPPLDQALETNIEGTLGMLELARRAPAGRKPVFLHISTCYVSGEREGHIPETIAVGDYPARERLGFDGFDPRLELEECRATVARVRAERRDPAVRAALFGEADGDREKVDRLLDERERRRLRDLGQERSSRWGFPNAYTYSKAVAEQLVAATASEAGLRFAIVRPAVLESAVDYPVPGFNQGINTSAPLVYFAARGQRYWPCGPEATLDVVPVDYAAHAIVAIAARARAGTADGVYQIGSSDTNPLHMRRLVELTAIRYRRTSIPGDTVLAKWYRRHFESMAVPEPTYRALGWPMLRRLAGAAAEVVKALPSSPAVDAVARQVRSADRSIGKVSTLLDSYVPFMAGPHVTFRTDRTRALHASLPPGDRAAHPYAPETIDWRRYWLEVHLPGLERWTYPEIRKLEEQESRKKTAAPRPPVETAAGARTLLDVLAAAAGRYEDAPAVARLTFDSEGAGAASADAFTYGELLGRARGLAWRLARAGVRPLDRVALLSENSPAWVAGYFGILGAGATAVPLDAAIAVRDLVAILKASGSRALLISRRRAEAIASDLGPRLNAAGLARAVRVLDLEALALEGDGDGPDRDAFPDVEVSPEAPASILYTSGTTGTPKGVRLPHRVFVAQVEALSKLFALSTADRILSVLPLHHAFEFTCGLLLPFASGARLVYVAETTPETVRDGLAHVRPTAMLGVPALFEAFYRKVRREAKAKGPAVERAFDLLLAFHRSFRETTGLNVGATLFPDVHRAFGGSLRYAISGGAALGREAFEGFRALGVDIYEGYGLTEAGPVVAANSPGGPKVKAQSVGPAIPGVAVKVLDPDGDGVGEIVVRGASVMAGYHEDEAATRAVLDGDGWLRTGDLGKLDHEGRLAIVGRSKDVIVDASGNTVWPDELEEIYGRSPDIAEIGVARVFSTQGKEVVGALVVPRDDGEGGAAAVRKRILEHFREVDRTLAYPKRVKVLRLVTHALPRTPTRKVKRQEVSRILTEILRHETEIREGQVEHDAVRTASAVRRLVAEVGGLDPGAVTLESRLQEDLGLDSLATVELVSAIAEETGRPAETLQGARTVGDLARLLVEGPGENVPVTVVTPEGRPAPAPPVVVRERPVEAAAVASAPAESVPSLRLPKWARWAGNEVLNFLQKWSYRGPLEVAVEGKVHIPHHTNCIVVSNHASHLDVGLVKHALRPYGRHMHSLGAKDYFFSSWVTKTYFENFTEVVPVDRDSDPRENLAGVVSLLQKGRTVLVFPEGTRSRNGKLSPFKPGVGYLVLKARVGILPVYLDGTHRALPVDAWVLKARDLGVRIGPFLSYEVLSKAVEGLPKREAYRHIAAIAEEAVRSLSERRGRQDVAHPGAESAAPAKPAERELERLMRSLPERFKKERVTRSITFYLKVGDDEASRYTIRLDPEHCEVRNGKGDAPADCVVKTEPDVMERLLRDGAPPSWDDIAAGRFKTNDPVALQVFTDAFGIAEK